jgi:hypothetical protein
MHTSTSISMSVSAEPSIGVTHTCRGCAQAARRRRRRRRHPAMTGLARSTRVCRAPSSCAVSRAERRTLRPPPGPPPPPRRGTLMRPTAVPPWLAGPCGQTPARGRQHVRARGSCCGFGPSPGAQTTRRRSGMHGLSHVGRDGRAAAFCTAPLQCPRAGTMRRLDDRHPAPHRRGTPPVAPGGVATASQPAVSLA